MIDRRRTSWAIVVAAGGAVLMGQFDASAVTLALPTIEREMGADPALTQWVLLGRILPLIVLSLPIGSWLDANDHRGPLVFSITGFTVAGLAAAHAPGMSWLIAARVAQGVFAAVVFALVPVITARASRPETRARAMSLVMTVGPLGGIAGPALGGVVTEHLGWPWIFYLNVPVGLLVAAIAITQLPQGESLRPPGAGWGIHLLLFGPAVTALLLAPAFAAQGGPQWVALAALTLPFIALWSRLPSVAPARALLRLPGTLGPHAALLAELTAVTAISLIVPYYLQRVAGASPAEAGTIMLALPLGMAVSGMAGGAMADRWTPRPVAITGSVILTVAIVALIPLEPGWTAIELGWRLALIGVGAGLFAGPNHSLLLDRVPGALMGTAGASASLARHLGIAFGPALATSAWAFPGYTTDGMRAAVASATVAAAVSALALSRADRFRSGPS